MSCERSHSVSSEISFQIPDAELELQIIAENVQRLCRNFSTLAMLACCMSKLVISGDKTDHKAFTFRMISIHTLKVTFIRTVVLNTQEVFFQLSFEGNSWECPS